MITYSSGHIHNIVVDVVYVSLPVTVPFGDNENIHDYIDGGRRSNTLKNGNSSQHQTPE